MRILFIGDIVGEAGLSYLEKNLASIIRDNRINMVVANGENITNGRGLRLKDYQRLIKTGVSAVTMGNHTFSQREIKEYINDSKIARPANFSTNYGKGYVTIKYNDKLVTIVNMLGRVYMNNMSLDCPFKTMDNILKEIQSDYIIVDLHAEATSEKIAFGYDFDGKVSAVVGTHTHVPTADLRVLPKGTLYVSDIGMTGPLNGVLGDDRDNIIDRFRSGVYSPANVSDEKGIQFNGVILDFNPVKNSITRVSIIEE